MKFTNPLADNATAPAAAPPAPSNAKPSGTNNPGAGPMIGDRQKIALPPVHRIASTAPPAKPAAPPRGIEGAMGQMADRLHPLKRR
jgi:hypothetical protein